MEFYSEIPFKTSETGVLELFKKILIETKADSGTIFIFDDKKNIIFKSLYNVKTSIESLNLGKIDEFVIRKKKMYRISDFNIIPELKYLYKKNNEIKESIIYPIFLNDMLLAIINLNKKNSLFFDEDVEKIKNYEKILISIMSNIYFVRKIVLQKEELENYTILMDLMLGLFEKTETQEEFINKIKEEIRKRFSIDAQFEKCEKKELFSIKINDEYFHVKLEYIDKNGILSFFDEKKEIDITKFGRIFIFLEQLLNLKKLQELNKKIDNLLITSKENMILKFTSWEVFQEINSALSGIYLNLYTIRDDCVNEIKEIKPSLDRIKNTIEDYKNKYVKTDVKKTSLNNIIDEIINEINIFEIKIGKNFRTEIELYVDKKIFKNALTVLFIDIFKIAHFLKKKINTNTNIIININKENEKMGLIEIILNEINIKEKDLEIDIIRQVLNNFHMDLIIENNQNTKIKILVPMK